MSARSKFNLKAWTILAVVVIAVLRVAYGESPGGAFLIALGVLIGVGIATVMGMRGRRAAEAMRSKGWAWAEPFALAASSAQVLGLAGPRGQNASPVWNGTLAVEPDRLTWVGSSRAVRPMTLQPDDLASVEVTAEMLGLRKTGLLQLTLCDGRVVKLYSSRKGDDWQRALAASGLTKWPLHAS